MSLTSIISTASSALISTQYAIGVSNTNVSNASNSSYSRQTYASSTVTSTTALYSGVITRATDAYLRTASLMSGTAASHASVTLTYLQNYDSALGTTTLGDDFASIFNDFQSALTALAASPSSSSAKSALVSSAQTLASKINDLSSTLQSLRTQASKDIATSVSEANQNLQTIASLNDQIVSLKAANGDTSALEDARDAALSSLSTLMGVKASIAADGRMTVYSTTGELLVGSKASILSYASPGQLSAGATYPDAIPGILLNGVDITSSLKTGTIGALVTLRDDTLPGEQARLDAFASQLATATNAAFNSGTAYPPPTSLTGGSAHAASDLLSGSGTFTLALVDQTGGLVSSVDIDLAAFSTVGELVTYLDGLDGLSARLNDQGALVLSSDTPAGISIGAGTGDLAGQSLSAFFGFNDLFTGTSGASLSVSNRLQSDPSALATSVLSGDLTTTGARVLTSGSNATVSSLLSALTSDSGGTGSLATFAASLLADAAALINTAASKAEVAQATYDNVQSRLANLTGVNVDEEMALLTQLQTQYQANAQLISTARDLFDVLMSMVR